MTSDIAHPLFAIDALTVQRGQNCLVHGLSLSLAAGGIVVLRGPNGAGKTSLLRVLAGIARPLSGTLRASGCSYHDDPAVYSKHVAYWGHRDGFKPEFSVTANLMQWCALAGRAFDASLLDIVGLEGKADTSARYLSAGQRRRLGLARLLGQNAKTWLLDEPFTALDTSGRALVIDLLEAHRKAGGGAILALHEPLDLQPHALLTLGHNAQIEAL